MENTKNEGKITLSVIKQNPTRLQLNVVTLADHPELQAESERLCSLWPEFMYYDRNELKLGGARYLSQKFSTFQFYFQTTVGKVIAIIDASPCHWDGSLADLPTGWSDMRVRVWDNHIMGIKTNTLTLFEMTIVQEYQGKGLAKQLLQTLLQYAQQNQFQAIIVPVRPTLKSSYPLTPMERYAYWKRPDGSPFDPWLRVHWQCGGEILSIGYPSMTIEAEISQWEKWTQLRFPESGEYIVPNTLVPIQIDLEMNIGRYLEPNIWVHHPITTKYLRNH